LLRQARLKPIHQNVQAKPYNVDKVPIPGGTFKTKMAVFGEMAFLQSQRDEQQHQHANKHVKAMKACEHVKG
jgi:hypothetical protein